VGAAAELLQPLLEAGVLAEGLDEGGERVSGRQAQLVDDLGVAAGREALDEPLAVDGEVELRPADEEVVGAEAVKGREPAPGRLEVAIEGLDVGRPGGDDAPTGDGEPTLGQRTLRDRDSIRRLPARAATGRGRTIDR